MAFFQYIFLLIALCFPEPFAKLETALYEVPTPGDASIFPHQWPKHLDEGISKHNLVPPQIESVYSFAKGSPVSLFPINSPKHASFSFPSDRIETTPGSTIQIVLSCQIEPGWHLYWKNPGSVGAGPTFSWTLPEEITCTDIQWPSPKEFTFSGTSFFGYEGNPQWIISLSISNTILEGTYSIPLKIFWISCSENCIPESEKLTLPIIISKNATPSLSKEVSGAIAQIPKPVSLSSISIDTNFAYITLPIDPILSFEIHRIIIFPENKSLQIPSTSASWNYSENAYHIQVPLHKITAHLLEEDNYFSGLIQFVDIHNTQQQTYSISAPVHILQEKPLPPSPLWKTPPITSNKEILPLFLFAVIGFLGGLLLNFTPCVLPVLGLKIMSLVSYKTLHHNSIRKHGLLYTLGALCTFWALAISLYSFRLAGNTAGWGFQLQEPRFVLFLIGILFCFALNLFGLFEFGNSIARLGSEINESAKASDTKKSISLWSSFVSGAVATIVATPCTGPLLGSVLGFTATIHPLEGLFLFTSIGIGVAFPFLLCTIFPSLLALLPKPGPWLLRLKQFFGFCLFGIIIWLFCVLKTQVVSLCLCCTLSGLLLTAIALWIYAASTNPLAYTFSRYIKKIVSVFLFILGSISLYATIDDRPQEYIKTFIIPKNAIVWSEFSTEKLTTALEENKLVFIEFSAKWCLTCQVNHIVFNSQNVIEAFSKHHVIALRADWTNTDEKITKMLESLGRNGVPVYVIFKKDQTPYILPEILTPTIVTKAIEEVADKR